MDQYQLKVDKILDSVTKTLKSKKQAKFSQGDIFLFSRWYEKLEPSIKQDVKKLVEDKQLVFVNGGWVSHDEACTTFDDIITNIMMG